MSVLGVQVHPGTYLDSLLLMVASTEMAGATGIEWAGAVMATARGLEELHSHGFVSDELTSLAANDLVLAVVGPDQAAVDAALEQGRRAAFSELAADARSEDREVMPRSLAEAARRSLGANVAIVSVPGEYAALEAHHALTAGMHVLLFSDGVGVEEEIELKDRGVELGLFVMGPGAGTAVLGRCRAGMPLSSISQSGDTFSRLLCATRILPCATALVAMSRMNGGSPGIGMPTVIGLVPKRASAPP